MFWGRVSCWMLSKVFDRSINTRIDNCLLSIASNKLSVTAT